MVNTRYATHGEEYIHRLRAEAALGRPLRSPECVHHADEQQSLKNPWAALVICQDQSYHLLLHMRTRVVKAGGDPNTEKYCATCDACKPFDAFMPRRGGLESQCRECRHQKWLVKQALRDARGHSPKPTKTHCRNGHEFTEANTYVGKDGYRECRTCHRENENKRRKG